MFIHTKIADKGGGVLLGYLYDFIFSKQHSVKFKSSAWSLFCITNKLFSLFIFCC